MDNFNLKNFINENNLGAYSRLEAKKRDVDGDGDIDSDDYMAAKDAAIKKAMGKTEAIADPDSLTSIIMGGLAAAGAIKALPKLVDLLGDGTGDITVDSLKKALSKKDVKEASKEEEETFHKKLDTLVHKTFGKRKEEMDENRFLAASMEDLEQVIRNLAHTGEMSEDEALELAIKKLESMLDDRDDMDENLKEEIGDGTFDEKMLNLTKAASIMNSYVKEFGGEEEQRMFRKIYMDLDDFENFMAYGNPDGALEEKYDREDGDGHLGTNTDDDFEREMIAQLAARNEDLDVGHQDDEPAMLKNTTYRAAKLAGMLYKKLDKYDNFPTEVDFPNWWQTKVTKAKDMLQAAYDYLDGEEGVAQVDAVTHEEVEEMKHPQYGTASNKYASRANKPGKFGNSPELNKTLGDTAAKAMDILKRKGLAEDNIKLSDIL